MEIHETLTRQLAGLARLKLTDDEVAAFTGQLRGVLDYVDQLQAVPVEGVDPFVHPVELSTALREDRAVIFSSDVLASAPEVEGHGFKVPPVL